MKLLFVAIFTTAFLNAATIYSIVDLGPPDESTVITSNVGTFPGGSWSAVYGTNASGAVAGYGDNGDGHFRAFIWTPSAGMIALGTLGGFDSWGMGISDNGSVTGHSTTSSGFIHAFAWSGGPLVDLGTLGGTSSYGYGINDSGAVVGTGDLPDGSMHAFLSTGGQMLDLNSLISAGSGWVLTGAYTINDLGRITGTGIHNGDSRQFELDPSVTLSASDTVLAAPEPSTVGLVGMLLAMVGCVRFKRRR